MTIIDDHSLLTQQQLDLLKQCAAVPFSLGTFVSIDNILTELKVDVIIEPGIITRSIPRELEEVQNYWNAKKKQADVYMEERNQAERNLDIISQNLDAWRTMQLRGLYDPKKNQIKLFPEEMRQEYSGKSMDELLVSTLAHETMHAYFNRPYHKSYPYIIFVEEPLAEFGMLLYLYETGSNYYQWAYTDVSGKRTCYKYGATLMDWHIQMCGGAYTMPIQTGCRKYLETYKRQLPEYSIPDYDDPYSLFGIRSRQAIAIDHIEISASWNRFSYDYRTQTLLLDGNWSPRLIYTLLNHYQYRVQNVYLHNRFFVEIDGRPLDILFDSEWGDCEEDIQSWKRSLRNNPNHYWNYDVLQKLTDLFTDIRVFVSLKNKTFYSDNGILFLQSTRIPVIDEIQQYVKSQEEYETMLKTAMEKHSKNL